MRVLIEYYGPAREAAGTGREELTFSDPTTALILIERHARQVGGPLESLLLHEGRLSKSLLIAVDDVQATADNPIPLRDGATISVIPPVSGG
jgi:molybdopterin converting factor small subunit